MPLVYKLNIQKTHLLALHKSIRAYAYLSVNNDIGWESSYLSLLNILSGPFPTFMNFRLRYASKYVVQFILFH